MIYKHSNTLRSFGLALPISMAIASFIGLFTPLVAQASVTLLTINVRGALDESSAALPVGTLGLIVVDTGGNGLGALTPTSILSGNYIGDGDDWIAGRVESVSVFGHDVFQLGGTSFDISDSTPTTGPATTDDEFYFIWLPGLGTASTEIVDGQSYGQVRPTDAEAIADKQDPWRVPADGNDANGFDPENVGAASLSVTAIPEPSASMLLLVSLSLIVFRRRRTTA